jgi:uncharacterized protein YjbI with pentapeptide repeats
MNAEELKIVLEKHKKWLIDEDGGQRADLLGANLRGANLRDADLSRADLRDADLRGANLRDANLYCADLRGADLRGANLYCADLRGANLYGAKLSGADLRGANLYGADLRDADLSGANLRGANLRGADLRGADLDYSSGLPMSCSGLLVNIDDRIAVQLLYHCLNNVMHSKNVSLELKKALLTAENCRIANKFHRVKACGKIEVYDENI